jgi:hypothetical protein
MHEVYTRASVTHAPLLREVQFTTSEQLRVGVKIACVVRGDWKIGEIVEKNEDESEILVSLLKKNGLVLSVPIKTVTEWLPFAHVLMCIENLINITENQYTLSDNMRRLIVVKFDQFKEIHH